MTKIGNQFNNDPLRKPVSGNNSDANEDLKLRQASIFKVARGRIGSKSVTQDLMNRFDTNGDGAIDYNEFEKLKKAYEEEMNGDLNSEKNSGMSIGELYNKVLNFFKNGRDNNIYIDGRIVNPDGNIGEVRQSKETGDCWFLSKMNALEHTAFGKESLDAARISRDGEYGLKINGKEYVFTTDEIQAAIDSGKYSAGDPDAIINELAFEKYFDELLKDPNNYNPAYFEDPEAADAIINDNTISSLQGGKEHSKLKYLKPELTDVTNLLAGMNTYSVEDKSSKTEILKLKSDNHDDLTMTFSSNYAIVLGADGQAAIRKMNPDENFGIQSHEYEVKRVEKDENGNVTGVIVTNPWDSKEIPLSLEQFNQISDRLSPSTKNNDLGNNITDIVNKYIFQSSGKPKVK